MQCWHLATRNSLLLHNVFLGRGVTYSVSALAMQPDLKDATTPYALGAGNSPKERLRERVRSERFATKPSRLKSLFVFDDRAVAEWAAKTWFPGEDRLVLEAQIMDGANVHRADARWLDRREPNWEVSATCYWVGEMSPDPIPEVLVHGAIFFPGWQSPPFGIWRP